MNVMDHYGFATANIYLFSHSICDNKIRILIDKIGITIKYIS